MSSHLHVERVVVGLLSVNCYLLICKETNKCVVIDPGNDGDYILQKVAELNSSVSYIINTHGHFDHIGGNKYLKEKTRAPLAIHSLDKTLMTRAQEHATLYDLFVDPSPPPDILLEDGQIIEVGSLKIKVIHTPGHTKGGVCLHVDSHLFSGDTLFEGSIGRTDLPGGNFHELINSINTRLAPLDGATMVYPGHGGVTTMEREEKTNPFLNKFL